jgi:hypothetical protein
MSNWGFGRFLSNSFKALVSSRYILLVVCRPEGAWVMGLPVCHDGVNRCKKGVIVLQPSLSIGDVRGSGVRVDGDESSHRFTASGNGDRLPTIGHTPQEICKVTLGVCHSNSVCLGHPYLLRHEIIMTIVTFMISSCHSGNL